MSNLPTQKLRYAGDPNTFMVFRKKWLDLAGASTVEYYAGASTKAQKQPLSAVVLFGYATDRTHIEGTFDAVKL